MANIQNIIERVDDTKPNAFNQKTKMAWIAELDGKIAADVMLMGIEEIRQLQYVYPDNLESEPLVSFPHDAIYDLWLGAKIDFANGEYNKYQNTMEMFNAHYGNFVRWFAATYEPAQGGRCGCGCDQERTGYYITAYGLAVKQGYEGTLDEWLASLHGDRVELRYVDDVIQWRWTSEPVDGEEINEDDAGQWQDLMTLTEAATALRSGLVLKKGEGVDSVVQVITTESGNPDLDNKPIATGEGAMALGKFCVVGGHNSHAVNYYNRITASRAFAANENNEVHGYCGAAFGAANVITEEAQRAAVFGAQNTVSGPYAIGAGRYNKVSGENAFGCGQSNEAQALNSFVCGKGSVAGARETFAGGNGSQALKQFDFAFGTGAIANGGAALAVGSKVQALAAYAWVGGMDSIVKGQAMAWGRGLLSNGGWQAVFGKFNVANNNALLVIGNGTADDARSNAFMVLNNAIVVGGQTLTAETIGNIATKAYIEEYINGLGVAEGAGF